MEGVNLVILYTTPLSRVEFLLGKLMPYFVIGMVDLVVAAMAAVYIFEVPLRRTVSGLMLVSAVFLIVVMLQWALLLSRLRLGRTR